MVHGREQGRGLLAENPNSEFMTLLMNIQHRLDDQVAMMQQQAELIQNLQYQQQGRIVDPEHEGPEDEDVNLNHAYGGDEHEGNGVENPPIRAPRGVEQGIERNLQPQPMRMEYLCERLCEMKTPFY